jgi:hypothetical protein
VESLQNIMAPHVLRRVKEDVTKEIPPKEETIIDVEMTTLQKKYYRAIFEKNRSFLYKGCKGSMPSLLNIQAELRKCCNHPFLIRGVIEKETKNLHDELKVDENDPTEIIEDGDPRMVKAWHERLIQSSGKLVLVNKLLPKLKADGHKVLIFSQMVMVLNILEEYCEGAGIDIERLDGQIHGMERQAAIDRFCEKDSTCHVFLLSTRAGGVGINLIAADTVIIFDSDWNPQNDIQAQARCHRIGQTKSVKIYRLITTNSFETEMFERASMKLGLEQAVMGDFGSKAKKAFSASELEGLLKKGAYGLLNDDDESARQFSEMDIDDILKQSSRVVTVDGPASSSLLRSKRTSFASVDSDKSIAYDDPEFWQKVLPDVPNAAMLTARLNDRSIMATKTQRNGFVDQVEQLVEGIMDLKNMGQLQEQSGSPEYEGACLLVRRIANAKKDFGKETCRVAKRWLEQLQGSKLRSRKGMGTVFEDDDGDGDDDDDDDDSEDDFKLKSNSRSSGGGGSDRRRDRKKKVREDDPNAFQNRVAVLRKHWRDEWTSHIEIMRRTQSKKTSKIKDACRSAAGCVSDPRIAERLEYASGPDVFKPQNATKTKQMAIEVLDEHVDWLARWENEFMFKNAVMLCRTAHRNWLDTCSSGSSSTALVTASSPSMPVKAETGGDGTDAAGAAALWNPWDVPQVGDEVFYIPEAHEKFLKARRKSEGVDLDAMMNDDHDDEEDTVANDIEGDDLLWLREIMDGVGEAPVLCKVEDVCFEMPFITDADSAQAEDGNKPKPWVRSSLPSFVRSFVLSFNPSFHCVFLLLCGFLPSLTYLPSSFPFFHPSRYIASSRCPFQSRAPRMMAPTAVVAARTRRRRP